MIFKITSLDRFNNTKIHYFDNISLEVFNQNKEKINFLSDVRYQGLKSSKPFSNIEDFKSTDIDHLRIQLGLKCNYSCKYCLQQEEREQFLTQEVALPPQSTAKIFIKLLEKINSVKRITLWGGEPLVYIKILYELVPLLRKRFPDTKLDLITNGSLLSEKIIDFLIQYSINLDVSHDGKHFSYFRDDKDPLDNPTIVKAILKYIDATKKDRRISFKIRTVITPLNIDLIDTIEYFYNIFGQKIKVYFESILRLDDKSILKDCCFNQEKAQELFSNIVTYCNIPGNDRHNPFISLRDEVSTIMVRIVNQQSMLEVPYRCGSAKKENITVDLKGNLIECPSSNIKSAYLGHINDLESLKNNKFKHWNTRKDCQKCPFLVGCKGGCSIANNAKQEIICESYKIYYAALFFSAWLHLFNSRIVSIQPEVNHGYN